MAEAGQQSPPLKHEEQMMSTDELAHHDPRLAMNWPLGKKLFASMAAWAFTFLLLVSLTCYAGAIPGVVAQFGVSQLRANLGFSLYLFGVMFAPLFTPHVSERVGRTPVYFCAALIMSFFLLGAGFSNSFTAFAACRFFAGFFGGPIVVNVEGTFADIWSPRHTITYYSFLAAAQYLGASVGPIICGGVVAETNWRWSQYIPLMFALAALLFGFGMPETYPRQIARNIVRQAGTGRKAVLSPALSGVGLGQMARYTFIDPIIMLVSEPIVIVSALCVGLSFAVVFSLFTAVPTVLMMTYNLPPHILGLGFLAGLAGSIMAIVSSVALEQLARPLWERRVGKMSHGVVAVEYRLVPGLLGVLFMVASLFWIGYTASPAFQPIVPITGSAFYVWGSMSVIISIVGYFFDAYPAPHAILSALTAMACFRLFCAGIVSLYFLDGIMVLGGPHMFDIFGSIAAVLTLWPIFLFFFGAKLRSKSRFAKGGEMSPMTMEVKEEEQSSGSGEA